MSTTKTTVTVTIQLPLLIEIASVSCGSVKFYQATRDCEVGCYFALPYFNQDAELEGYLFYHNPTARRYDDYELLRFGKKVIKQASKTGRAGKLRQHDYPPAPPDKVELILRQLVEELAGKRLLKCLSLKG